MIDKYLLEDLSLRSDEKGELARWVIQLQADVDTERRKSASLESVIYARDTRIAELEAKTAMTMGVGSGNGNLFVHGDYDSIKAAQAIVLENESLRAKLATPVRLSCETHPRCRTQHAKDVRAAGFTVTVERDEEPCHEKA
ncbi:TPA: hypothetical protein ACXI1U_002470 [Serratia marcescens]|uniref:Uncharacterized protein n=1 Tax=Serratia ureilytica TaxID=300181 RepID=A0ABU0VLC1_9GAMM|nr:hypothetical protein [Serratia ureilytica]MCU7062493.1 hypothetical protein [Serratia ureilytica]MDQ1809048.1 hypothetical protein [Serratia ureilytica]MDQ1838567.1 hypothetical protein [Serratia ureilytica]MDQ1862236.1 hypothetical protein [Serratia ureilytica]